MEFWAEVFPRAMEKLNTEPLPYNGPYQSQWGIRHLSGWADVQAKLDMARKDYYFYNDQQHTGKFRRKLRLVADKAAVPLQQGMKLIPDIDVASPVIGVIGLLLDAAEVRETVNTGFDDLPEVFARIDFYFKSYPDDRNIAGASVDLVLAIFKAVEEAVIFYTSAQGGLPHYLWYKVKLLRSLNLQLAAKRAGRVILTGEQYQQKLLECLKDIRVCSDRLEKHGHMSFTYHVMSDGAEARKSHTTIMQDNWATHQALGAILQGQIVGRAGTAWLGGLLNRFLGFLEDQEKNWLPGTPISSRPATPAHFLIADYGPPPWAVRELWSLLRIPHIDEIDLERVLRNVGEVISEDRGRAEQALSAPQFRSWITNPGSAKLLVHGDFDNTAAASQPVSPFSVLCATMVKALRLRVAEGRSVSLVFFCGCHLAYDQHRGGAAMIRSLIVQLLRHFPETTIQPGPAELLHGVERGDMGQLCGLFLYLIRLLPPHMTVFCFIDGINEYESEEYVHEMDEVVLALLGLVNERPSPGRATFKLLLMSPRPTVEVRRVFDHEPGAILHMAQLPVLEGGVSFDRIEEQLGARQWTAHGKEILQRNIGIRNVLTYKPGPPRQARHGLKLRSCSALTGWVRHKTPPLYAEACSGGVEVLSVMALNVTDAGKDSTGPTYYCAAPEVDNNTPYSINEVRSPLQKMDFQCALITGGGGGIGKALAQYFISQGKKVIIAGRTESNLRKTCKEIGAAAYYVLDTGVVSETPAVARRLTSEHPDLDCLVNNAGVQRPLSVIDMAPEDFLQKADEEIDINTRGPMHLALHLLSHLRQKPNAVIMNVSSVLGLSPFVLVNPVYNGTKAWLHFWSINLRAQLEGTNVKVIEIVPPTVATDLHREREDPDDNKKSSNPDALTVDEFIAEISGPLHNGQEIIGAGMGVGLVEEWDKSMGIVFRKLRK
ncbi:hypothetical protein O1611_g8286 [Lasiodiplodia mahajangana]|uniref:Uncharacterized protein n=1 Tax=Lasiodiplodia mahajangana TaxID=1108764 RepID=A0ACC2JDS0_9PEZI|nr:hypothetical protein O1611_g8286 [Lasiodiplodia mahajangana]